MPLLSYRTTAEQHRLLKLAAGAAGISVQAYMDRGIRAQILRDGARDKSGPVAAALDKLGRAAG